MVQTLVTRPSRVLVPRTLGEPVGSSDEFRPSAHHLPTLPVRFLLEGNQPQPARLPESEGAGADCLELERRYPLKQKSSLIPIAMSQAVARVVRNQ